MCKINRIIINAGPPPSPTIQYLRCPPQVCFNACCNYDIAYYGYTINDITNDVLAQSQTPTKTCVPMPSDSFPSKCSPFDVSVEAYNRVGVSDPASMNVSTGSYLRIVETACIIL